MAKTTGKAAAKPAAKKTIKKAKTAGVETNLIRRLMKKQANPKVAQFSPGDTVNVFVKVIDRKSVV